jgi:hypothetical protein
LADEGMLDLFSNASVLHVQTTESDHCALLIKLCRFDVLGNRGHGKRFRYENTWQRHESYEHTVAAAWAGGCNSHVDRHSALAWMQSSLKTWEGEVFGSVKKELVSFCRRLESIL